MDLNQQKNMEAVPDRVDHYNFNQNKRLKVEGTNENINNARSSSLPVSFSSDPDNVVDEPRARKTNGIINRLNHDCLEKVLMYLPITDRLEMEKVCQKWKESTELSWHNLKKLDLDNLIIPLDEKEKMLKLIMTRFAKCLAHLIITDDYYYQWTTEYLKNSLPNLTHFEFVMKQNSGHIIFDEELVQIIASMKKLKFLKVSTNLWGSDDTWNEILEELPNDMEEIYLTSCIESSVRYPFYSTDPIGGTYEDVTMNIINQELDKFKSLRSLTLRGFHLSLQTMESIMLSESTLVHLDLSKCALPPEVFPIFSNLVDLEYLDLREIKNFNTDAIIEIAHNCLKLKHLKLEFKNRFRDMTEVIPHHVFREFHNLNLEYLHCAGVDKSIYYGENIIYGLTTNWKELKYLNVGEGHEFSFSDIQELVRFNKLEFLNLSKITIDTQISLISIASDCPELKELNMSFVNISEVVLEKLTTLRKLEKLNFSNCNNLTGNLLTKITNNCKKLVNLNISRCQNITEDSLIEVGKLKYLKVLIMDCVDVQIPNTMFDDLYRLEILSCASCRSVKNRTVRKVLDNCENLSYLYLCGTKVDVGILIYASNRRRIFKKLTIHIEPSVKTDYHRDPTFLSPYVSIR